MSNIKTKLLNPDAQNETSFTHHLAEDALIEWILHRTELGSIDTELTTLAMRHESSFEEFQSNCRSILERGMTQPVANALDWHYIATHWWDGLEEDREHSEQFDDYYYGLPMSKKAFDQYFGRNSEKKVSDK